MAISDILAGLGKAGSRYFQTRRQLQSEDRARQLQELQLFASLLEADPAMRPVLRGAYEKFAPGIKKFGELPVTSADTARKRQLVKEQIDFHTSRYPGKPLPPELIKAAKEAGYPIRTRQTPVMEEFTRPDTEPRETRPGGEAARTTMRPTGVTEEVEDLGGKIRVSVPGFPVPVEVDPSDPKNIVYFQHVRQQRNDDWSKIMDLQRHSLARDQFDSLDAYRTASTAFNKEKLKWQQAAKKLDQAIANRRVDIAAAAQKEMERAHRAMESIASRRESRLAKGPASDPAFMQDLNIIRSLNKYGDDPRQKAIVDAAVVRMEKRFGIEPTAPAKPGAAGPGMIDRIKAVLARIAQWYAEQKQPVGEEEEENPLEDLYNE